MTSPDTDRDERDLIFNPEYIRGVAIHGLGYRPPRWTGKTPRPEASQTLADETPRVSVLRGRVIHAA